VKIVSRGEYPSERSRGCNAADGVREARLSIPWNSRGDATGSFDFAALRSAQDDRNSTTAAHDYSRTNGRDGVVGRGAGVGSRAQEKALHLAVVEIGINVNQSLKDFRPELQSRPISLPMVPTSARSQDCIPSADAVDARGL
jgi:hypothetical protein